MNQLYIIVKIQAQDKCRVKAGVCVPARENNNDWPIEQITMNITASMKYHQPFIFLNLAPWISKARCPILFHLFEDQFFPPKNSMKSSGSPTGSTPFLIGYNLLREPID